MGASYRDTMRCVCRSPREVDPNRDLGSSSPPCDGGNLLGLLAGGRGTITQTLCSREEIADDSPGQPNRKLVSLRSNWDAPRDLATNVSRVRA